MHKVSDLLSSIYAEQPSSRTSVQSSANKHFRTYSWACFEKKWDEFICSCTRFALLLVPVRDDWDRMVLTPSASPTGS